MGTSRGGLWESTTWFYLVVIAPAERLKMVFEDPRSGETKAGVFTGGQGLIPSRLISEGDPAWFVPVDDCSRSGNSSLPDGCP